MMRYEFSRRAEDDLSRIYEFSAVQFGTCHADDYVAGLRSTLSFLEEYPRAARERIEIDPPIRVYAYKAHVILYVLRGENIFVVRIRHGREDWTGDL